MSSKCYREEFKIATVKQGVKLPPESPDMVSHLGDNRWSVDIPFGSRHDARMNRLFLQLR